MSVQQKFIFAVFRQLRPLAIPVCLSFDGERCASQGAHSDGSCKRFPSDFAIELDFVEVGPASPARSGGRGLLARQLPPQQQPPPQQRPVRHGHCISRVHSLPFFAEIVRFLAVFQEPLGSSRAMGLRPAPPVAAVRAPARGDQLRVLGNAPVRSGPKQKRK